MELEEPEPNTEVEEYEAEAVLAFKQEDEAPDVEHEADTEVETVLDEREYEAEADLLSNQRDEVRVVTIADTATRKKTPPVTVAAEGRRRRFY